MIALGLICFFGGIDFAAWVDSNHAEVSFHTHCAVWDGAINWVSCPYPFHPMFSEHGDGKWIDVEYKDWPASEGIPSGVWSCKK
jgi:hypothetical protein